MKSEAMLSAQKEPTLGSEQILTSDGPPTSSHNPKALSLMPIAFTTSAMSFAG
jgi:hypothetical protein